MALHSPHRHRQGIGDLPVGQPFADQQGDFAFPAAQRQGRGHCQSCRRGRCTVGDKTAGASAGGQPRAPAGLAFEDRRRLRGRVGGRDPVAHVLQFGRDLEQRVAIAVGQCAGPARHQRGAGALDEAGEFGQALNALVIAELQGGLQAHDLARVLTVAVGDVGGLPRQRKRLRTAPAGGRDPGGRTQLCRLQVGVGGVADVPGGLQCVGGGVDQTGAGQSLGVRHPEHVGQPAGVLAELILIDRGAQALVGGAHVAVGEGRHAVDRGGDRGGDPRDVCPLLVDVPRQRQGLGD